ncbi:MAG: ATP-binding protein [bacterium]|nr:ATP-binding protein [bacterium]
MTVDYTKKKMLTLPVEIGFEHQQEFISKLKESVRQTEHDLLVDCSKVEQVTSTHVNMLWRAYSLCKDYGLKMTLCNPTEGVIRVLNALDLGDMFFIEQGLKDSTGGQTKATEFAGLDDSLELEIKLESRQISLGLKRLQEFLRRVSIAPAILVEIETIFYELATNINLHSGLSNGDSLHCSVVLTDKRVTLTFVDAGVPFDPSSVEVGYDPKSMISNYKKRGLGLVMIQRMADSISYERRNGQQNVVTVTKDGR